MELVVLSDAFVVVLTSIHMCSLSVVDVPINATFVEWKMKVLLLAN